MFQSSRHVVLRYLFVAGAVWVYNYSQMCNWMKIILFQFRGRRSRVSNFVGVQYKRPFETILTELFWLFVCWIEKLLALTIILIVALTL